MDFYYFSRHCTEWYSVQDGSGLPYLYKKMENPFNFVLQNPTWKFVENFSHIAPVSPTFSSGNLINRIKGMAIQESLNKLMRRYLRKNRQPKRMTKLISLSKRSEIFWWKFVCGIEKLLNQSRNLRARWCRSYFVYKEKTWQGILGPFTKHLSVFGIAESVPFLLYHDLGLGGFINYVPHFF